MPISDAVRNRRLWADTGTNAAVLLDVPTEDNDGIPDIFAEAAERYANDSAKQSAYARVIVFRRLLAPSAMQGRYVQNQSEEDLEKIFDNLEKLRDYWQEQVEVVSDPPAASASPFFFGVVQGQRGR